MSDQMMLAVLQMPYDMAMSDELSRRQFYNRVQELVARFEALPVRDMASHGNAEDQYTAPLAPTAQPKEPEQEPVAYGMWDSMIGYGGRMMYVRLGKGQDGCTVPLYTTPPQRKPMTDEQIWDAYMEIPAELDCNLVDLVEFARAIEAAHGIKGEA